MFLLSIVPKYISKIIAMAIEVLFEELSNYKLNLSLTFQFIFTFK